VALLSRACGLAPGWRVADLGSGTGLSALPFLNLGCTVFGVEPNAAMRSAAERLLAGREGFRSVAGSAEETGLPDASVELVIAGQAFHWFDPDRMRAEAGRILDGIGWVAVFWNTRRVGAEGKDPFAEGYEALLARWGTDYARVRHDRMDPGRLQRLFPGGFETHRLPNAQTLDLEGLIGRLRSSSYLPPEGHPDHEEMLAAAEGLFRATEEGGFVEMRYETEVHVGPGPIQETAGQESTRN
jgi:SAM-dependent methyltransferase